jgi:hypothetical protein
VDWINFWTNSLKGLVSAFFGSGTDNTVRVIGLLQNTPWPALNSSWFLVFWKNSFGLAILLAVAALIISLVSAWRYHNELLLLNALLDFVKTFLIGFFLLVVLNLLMWIVDLIGQLIVVLATFGYHGQWYDSLVALKTAEDLPGVATFNVVASIGGKFMVGEVEIIQGSVLIFAIIYMIGFSFYRYGLGHLIFRGANSALLVALTSKLAILLVLVVTSIVLRSEASVGTDALGKFTFAVVICALIPLILFFFYMRKIRRMQIEGAVITKSEEGRYGVGAATSRSYAGRIPEPGAGLERSAKAAGFIGAAATVATLAFPEAAPVLLGVAKVSGHAANAARWKSGDQRKKAEARKAIHSERRNA